MQLSFWHLTFTRGGDGIFLFITLIYHLILLTESAAPVKKIDLSPSAFYLDPVGIEKGPWGPWGSRSQCSRPCDGGVAHQQRSCQANHNAANQCVGSRKRYFMCNTHSCPDDQSAHDFRAEQCSKFDETPYQGQKHKWIPYRKGNNKCELLCRPQNGSFYVSFASQVIDGTPCSQHGQSASLGEKDDRTSVCVAGKCVSVGCDGRLGSHMQEDKCRVCGGDGSRCKFVEGLYDDSDVPESSYAEFLIIPSGSTNIQIRERRPSENYLAVGNVSGEYVLNGDFKVESGKRLLHIAGTVFVYHRQSPIHPPAELLTAKGPTTQPVTIAMLHQERNPGVLYEFYAPNSVSAKAVGPLAYSWLARSYGACSASCAGGQQTRQVVCVRTGDYEPVDESHCHHATLAKPRSTRLCNLHPCPAYWKVDEWEACSSSCGGGQQHRSVICVQSVGLHQNDSVVAIVPNSQCKGAAVKPESVRRCNQFKCPEWSVGDWSPCSAICGPGVQIRTVQCRSRNSKPALLPDSACSIVKRPIKKQQCLLAPCEGLEWALADGTVVGPVEKQKCQGNVTCDGQWFSGPWMTCTATCGGGSRRRYVICLKNETVVEANNCEKEEKPVDSEDCGKEPCDKEGFVPMKDCATSKYGCCPDEQTAAAGADGKGCPASDASQPCAETEFGCCPDNATVALGPFNSGCNNDSDAEAAPPSAKKSPRLRSVPLFPIDSNSTLDNNGTDANSSLPLDGLGQDLEVPDVDADNATDTKAAMPGKQKTQALSWGNDTLNGTDAEADIDGESLNGNGTSGECDQSPFGCCPDNTTAATDAGKSNCDEIEEGSAAECAGSEFGCCPNGKSPAKGPNNEGCKADRMLHRQPLGECQHTEFGCCADGQTAAVGKDYAGCPESDCANSYHGCCPDGLTVANGPNYEDCPHTKPFKQTCELHQDQGPTRDWQVKWWFDQSYGDCTRFWYGGTEGNDNKFDSEESCKAECVSPRGVEVCNLPKIQGPCDQNMRMWYYDKYVRECLPFDYGGCLGNENRFESREDCQQRCVETQIPDICQHPIREGTCPGQLPRWGFDKATGRCNQFLFSGCGGNGNRFMSDDQCLKKCSTNGDTAPTADICTLEKAEGNCKDYYPRFYFNPYNRACEQFIYTGCEGNENRFETLEECSHMCSRYLQPSQPYPPYPDQPSPGPDQPGSGPVQPTINPAVQHCFLPSDRGTCERSLPRWHYDSSDGVCKRFLYSGCGGNGNNFETQLHCLDDCAAAQDRCDLPKVVGPCRGALNVYYFDKYEKRCLQFQYGGCQGNANRFQTWEECERNCTHAMHPPTAPPYVDVVHTIAPEYPEAQTYPSSPGQNPYLAICSMAVDAGACDERIARYYYDISQGKCLSFTYTGCGGNQNHFHTLEQCEGFCAQFGVGCPSRTCEVQCPYGYENDGLTSCPTCRCADPCRTQAGQCPPQSQCRVQMLPNGEYVATCQSSLEKAGTCPSLEDVPPGSCSRQCQSDNDCGANQKCCNNGCGSSCMTPVELNVDTALPPTDYPPYPQPGAGGDGGPHYPPYPQPGQGPDTGAPYPAYIAGGPSELSAEPGQSITLPCQAVGEPAPQVFWMHNNQTIRPDDVHYSQRGNDLWIEAVRAEDVGDFVCMANNGLGPSAEHYIRLNIQAVVKIDGSDMMVNSRLGERAILKCVAHGTPQPRVTWTKGGEAIGHEAGKYRQMPDDSLVIEDVSYDDQSVYVCSADNGLQTPAVKNVVLRVHEEIKAQITAQSNNLRAGSIIRLDCRAGGYPQPRLRWYLNGQEIVSDGDRSQVFSNGTLIIKKARASDAGVYQCQASNEQSSGTDSIRVSVTGAPLSTECTDNEFYANCKLIVVAELCSNEYYAKFCCKSCSESGQLRQSPSQPYGRRRRHAYSYQRPHFL